MPDSIPGIDRISALWTGVIDRLGDRRTAFLDAAAAQALRRGLTGGDAARYVNLCFAFGPAFEDRPENEWALAVLIDDRLASAVQVHQLVRRAADALRRRGADPRPLVDADAALLDMLDAERRAADPDTPPLGRVACDVEAVELRLTDTDWRQEYRRDDHGSWQRIVGPAAPPAVRVDAARPMPPRLAVLTNAPGDGPAARLQVRQIVHGGCAGGRHPAMRRLDAQGLAAWQGAEARSAGWPVQAPHPPPPVTGLCFALAEETAPGCDLLELPTCGLRDDGVPIGALRTQLWTYPAQQWLYVLHRDAGEVLAWPRAVGTSNAAAIGADAVADTGAGVGASAGAGARTGASVSTGTGAADTPSGPPTRLRIERDGAPVDAAGWRHGFDHGLPQALAAGFDKLFTAWRQTAADGARMTVTPRLFTGRAVSTWGWREAPGGIAEAPFLRLLADLDLAVALDVTLEGEVETAGAKSRVRLAARGGVPLVLTAAREAPEPPLAALLGPAVASLRLPFAVEHDPVAGAEAVVCSRLGPCSGALVGEAGLRPRLSGGSGWQWYLRLAVEPVLAPMALHDPVLGQTQRTLALLPAMPLVDWSLG